jgi:hypothetical protein
VGRLLRTSALAVVAAAAALLVPASALAVSWQDDIHYIAGHVPRGFHPFEVDGSGGLTSFWYGYHGGEQQLITVHTHTDGRCCYDTTADERPVRIRGHRGTIARLVDGEAIYGREIFWEEQPGVMVEVVDQAWNISRRELFRIARSVRQPSPGEWRRLLVAATVVPSEEHLRARPSRILARGAVAGRPWIFSVRMPPGYPLFSWDRRVPCPELRYAGASTLNRWDCEQFEAFWRVIGDQIWVYGALGAQKIRRIRVRDYYHQDEPGVVVPTHAVLGGRFRFYLAPMPRDTCSAVVYDADAPRGRGFLGGDGPAGSDPEAKRCEKAHPPAP